ncbi:hypothetical protein OEZ86_006348 [Tetradesmus obliquus]|nr:hypothetical protein OEZ86_006348 [Tetradesmus obliquus]
MAGLRPTLGAFVALFAFFVISAAQQQSCKHDSHAVFGSVIKTEDGRLAYRTGVLPDAVAHGAYLDSGHTPSNFGKLRVVASSSFSDAEQMAAAGYLEGYLTASRINDHHHNLKHYFIHQLNASLEKPMQWVDQQDKWLRQQVAANQQDTYWQVQGLLLAQLDGLYEGYDAAMAAADAAGTLPAGEWLSRDAIMFLNSNGELYDLMDMYDAEEAAARLARMQPDELLTHLALQGKCSALIKVTADLGDLLFGHSTWDSFTAMTRIYKHYQLQLQQVSGGVAAQGLSFSSYPGELASDDDFYMTSAQLVVLETTNHIYNFSILEGLSPASVPSWQRVRAANLLASNGSAWVDTFKRHNSGTYNNQYMVLDLKRFVPRKQLQEGLLWVAEQLPGVVEAADMTQVLARGYWPSYNVAFFPNIYEKAGYPSLIDAAQGKGPQYGDPARWLMYQVSPRANIFRRDQGNVHDLEHLKHLMRYNDFQNDDLSNGQPVASVCSRGDLAKTGAIPKGCYDTKVSSYSMALAMESEVVGGPTAQGQPAFEWGDKWDGFAHRGMPNRYDFRFEKQSAADLLLPGVECVAGKQQQQQQQQQQGSILVAGSAGSAGTAALQEM